MRVLCRHGHYAFYPTTENEISRFCDFYDITLVRDGDFYTFEALKGIKDYSINNNLYEGALALKTISGKPWEVMRANDLVYSIALKKIVPKMSILIVNNPIVSNRYYISETALLQSGSLNNVGKRLMSYDAMYYFDIHKLRIMDLCYD